MPPLGYDCATPVDPAAARSYGYTFGIRYLAPSDARYDWKRFKPAEQTAMWAQALGILLVWESYAGRALEGFQAGVQDAQDAQAQARALGYPDDVPIFFACDTNTTANQARPYFQGAVSVRPCSGAYGGIDVVDALLADGTVPFTWQTCAWSTNASGVAVVSQTAHLYQRLHPTTHLQGQFDEDVMLRPIPMWTAQTQPAPTPAPAPEPQPAQPPNTLRPLPLGDDDMPFMMRTPDTEIDLVAGTVIHLDEPGVEFYAAQGIKEINFRQEDGDALRKAAQQ